MAFRSVALPADAYVAVEIPASYTTSLNGLATYISQRYKGTEAQLWALYSWEASYLRYDMSKRSVQLSLTNPDELALWTIKNRKGVCANFAAVFYAVAKRLGVETYLVGGYSVTHNNFRDDGHQWCACLIDGKPYIFDPTWGGGYMLNDVQYVHRLSADYFMVEPAKMVQTHMPEDPLFQFLDYPHYYDEIDNPGADHPVPVYFNWRDSLAHYNAQDTLARLGGQIARMRANGFANDWIKMQILRYQHNYEAHVLNRQVDVFNNCVQRVNELVRYINNGYVPVKTASAVNAEIEDLENTLSGMAAVLDDTEFTSDALVQGAANMSQQVQQLMASVSDLSRSIRKHFDKQK